MAARSLAKTESPKPLTKAAAARACQVYTEREESRKGLHREAAALARLNAPLAAELVAFVDAHKAGRVREVTVTGWRVSVVSLPESVNWKDEFVRLAGEDAASQLEAAAKKRLTRERVEIESTRRAKAEKQSAA